MSPREARQLTVRELIAALEAVEDKGLPAWGEGCDCTNPVTGVTIDSLGLVIDVDL